MKAKINIEVNLASHTQYAPQVKFPHIDPVTKTIMLIINPIGDKDLATVNAIGDLNINHALIKNGFAILYNFSRASEKMKSFEKEARKNKLNLWQGSFLEPKKYRNRHK